MSKYLSVKDLLISKQTGTISQSVQKIHFGGGPFGRSPGGGNPKLCQNILSVKYLVISKQTGTIS